MSNYIGPDKEGSPVDVGDKVMVDNNDIIKWVDATRPHPVRGWAPVVGEATERGVEVRMTIPWSFIGSSNVLNMKFKEK